MTKRPRSTATTATDLSTPVRVLLFCVASDTEWEQAGITGATVTAMMKDTEREAIILNSAELFAKVGDGMKG
jgi:hypothetical protein